MAAVLFPHRRGREKVRNERTGGRPAQSAGSRFAGHEFSERTGNRGLPDEARCSHHWRGGSAYRGFTKTRTLKSPKVIKKIFSPFTLLPLILGLGSAAHFWFVKQQKPMAEFLAVAGALGAFGMFTTLVIL